MDIVWIIPIFILFVLVLKPFESKPNSKEVSDMIYKTLLPLIDKTVIITMEDTHIDGVDWSLEGNYVFDLVGLDSTWAQFIYTNKKNVAIHLIVKLDRIDSIDSYREKE